MISLQASCDASFLENVHPCLLAKAQYVLSSSDFLIRTIGMERILKLSKLAKTLHPSLCRSLPDGFNRDDVWILELVTLNMERMVVLNTVGNVHKQKIQPFQPTSFVDSEWLTAKENDAKISGKLEGITRFEKTSKNLWHLRMDSFVHPAVWFEIDYNANTKKFSSYFDLLTDSYTLNGRMSEFAASDLRIRVMRNRLRVDDLLNPEVWAECELPQRNRKTKRS